MTISELKKLSKEEFLAHEGLTEEIYEALQKSKEGWIKISRTTDGAGDQGFTSAFGEGISCKISNPQTWYVTSVIQSIDWENHTFKTLNSVYNFKFKDRDQLEADRKKNLDRMNKLFENLENNGSKD